MALRRVPDLAGKARSKFLKPEPLHGVLTTGLFRRVLIDHPDHFAVLEAW
jgi:hypothetical protein